MSLMVTATVMAKYYSYSYSHGVIIHRKTHELVRIESNGISVLNWHCAGQGFYAMNSDRVTVREVEIHRVYAMSEVKTVLSILNEFLDCVNNRYYTNVALAALEYTRLLEVDVDIAY